MCFASDFILPFADILAHTKGVHKVLQVDMLD